MIFDWFYDLNMAILYPVTIVLIAASGEIGNWFGLRFRRANTEHGDVGTLAAASLGLLALLIAFSFSMAASRYDQRRNMVLEEANAIGSAANFTLMLPQPAQEPILHLLRDYVAIRAAFGVPFDPSKMRQDITRSLELQTRLWQQAIAVIAANPQSAPAGRFVASLNEMNNIHERRLSALRNHVPGVVMFMLVGTAMVALGFSGYNAGVIGARRRLPILIMSVMVALLIMLIVDLDRPYRGLIQVPAQALADAAQSIPP
jgi:Protein of unknown function (DUF4239)